MSRPPNRPGRKRAAAAKPKAHASAAPRANATTLDPQTEQAVNRLFFSLIRRIVLTCLIMLAVGWIVTALAKSSQTVSVPIIYYAVLFGIAIAYHRGVEKVFEGVKQIGVDKYKQRRYADAVFALGNFHRMGNMGRDRTGEAHYYLMRAYQDMGDAQKAGEILAWLQKHRGKSEWATRAATHGLAP